MSQDCLVIAHGKRDGLRLCPVAYAGAPLRGGFAVACSRPRF